MSANGAWVASTQQKSERMNPIGSRAPLLCSVGLEGGKEPIEDCWTLTIESNLSHLIFSLSPLLTLVQCTENMHRFAAVKIVACSVSCCCATLGCRVCAVGTDTRVVGLSEKVLAQPVCSLALVEEIGTPCIKLEPWVYRLTCHNCSHENLRSKSDFIVKRNFSFADNEIRLTWNIQYSVVRISAGTQPNSSKSRSASMGFVFLLFSKQPVVRMRWGNGTKKKLTTKTHSAVQLIVMM